MRHIVFRVAALATAAMLLTPGPVAARPPCEEGEPGWQSIGTANVQGTLEEGWHTFRIDFAFTDFDGTVYADFAEGTFYVTEEAEHVPGAVGLTPWNTGIQQRVPKRDLGYVGAMTPGQNAKFVLGWTWFEDDPVVGTVTRQMVRELTSEIVQTASLDGGDPVPMHYGDVFRVCFVW